MASMGANVEMSAERLDGFLKHAAQVTEQVKAQQRLLDQTWTVSCKLELSICPPERGGAVLTVGDGVAQRRAEAMAALEQLAEQMQKQKVELHNAEVDFQRLFKVMRFGTT